MKKSDTIRPGTIGYLAGSLLESDIKHLEEQVQISCGWAFDLSENIAPFQSTFLQVVSDLDDLKQMPLRKDFDRTFEPVIRKTLRQMKNYCQRMATEDGRLSVSGITEDCEELNHHAGNLRKVLKKARKKKKR